MSHIPVLKKEIVNTFSYFSDRKSAVFVDGTLGLAGHSLAIAEQLSMTNDQFSIIGTDKDQQALEIARSNIAAAGLENNFILIHNDFKEINHILDDLKIKQIDGALLDLGVSSLQLDDRERGFSFQDIDQPLDMRMNQSDQITAADILNTKSETEIAQILRQFGEEHFANRIARKVVEKRQQKPFARISDLINVLENVMPAKSRFGGKIHFATRTFQGLRIAVNSELANLEESICDFVRFLSPGSRLAIISFHSLEDRIVKNTFNKLANPCVCPPDLPCVCGKKPAVNVLTKKPIVADPTEINTNPRSRSAKLRVAEKI